MKKLPPSVDASQKQAELLYSTGFLSFIEKHVGFLVTSWPRQGVLLALETLNAKLIKRHLPVRLDICDVTVPPVIGGFSKVATLNGFDESDRNEFCTSKFSVTP